MTAVQESVERARRLTLRLENTEVAEQGQTAIGDPSTGTVKVGPSLATGLFLGIFHADADASEGEVDCDVDFLQEITILFRGNDGSISSSDIFNKCYIVDESTVSKTSTNRALAGTILIVDEDLDEVGFAVGRPFLENT